MREGADFEEAVLAAAARPTAGIHHARLSANEEPTPFEGDVLGWFPKQFGPGDIDGVGAKRLLGTPHIDPAWVLVRETGQNSWDARGTSPAIDFVLNLRRLERPVVETLRTRIFTGDAPKTGLVDLLQRDEVWALEVSDRGTVGLGGPIRNDLAVDPGEDTNFIDLIFNIGAPRDVHLGGGTYGFGKTIVYLVSSVGSILVWSHCEGSRGLEHRLIGSAIGEGFNRNGFRFTGRHWWGNAVQGQDRVEPVIGDLAQELGAQVFANQFEHDTTGTSILVLDPKLGGETPEEDIQLLAEAIVWNLWPKLLVDQSGHSRMNIRVQLNGVDVVLPGIEMHPILRGHAQCLLAVRAAQEGKELGDLGLNLPVSVQEVWSLRPRRLLGHLALTRYPSAPGDSEPSHHVTLMRHQAELVVKYLERQELDVEGFQWAGVFKPVAAVDDSFAQAEPPAHDDWVPPAVQDKSCRRDVSIALRRIQTISDAFITPQAAIPADAEPVQSAAKVGDMLADLLGGAAGPAPDGRKPPSPEGGRRPVRPRVDIVGTEIVPASDKGWTRTLLDIQLTNAGAVGASVDVSVRVGIDGGSEDDAEVIRILGWQDGPADGHVDQPVDLAPNEIRRFAFEAQAELAIDIDARVV
jgi:hypothetical protein